MLVHEAADYSLVNADVDRWSEHHQEVADNHSSSMLTGGEGSSERRHQQEVADNCSSGRIELCVFGVPARFLYLMSYFSHSHILRNFLQQFWTAAPRSRLGFRAKLFLQSALHGAYF